MASLQDLYNELADDPRLSQPETFEKFQERVQDPAYVEKLNNILPDLGYDLSQYEGLKKKEVFQEELSQQSGQPSATGEETQTGTAETPQLVQQDVIAPIDTKSTFGSFSLGDPNKRKKLKEDAEKKLPYDDSYTVDAGYLDNETGKIEFLVTPKDGASPYVQTVDMSDPWAESAKKAFPNLAVYGDKEEWNLAKAQAQAKMEVTPPKTLGTLPQTTIEFVEKKPFTETRMGKFLSKTLNWDQDRINQYYQNHAEKKQTPVQKYNTMLKNWVLDRSNYRDIKEAKEAVKRENLANAQLNKSIYQDAFTNGRSKAHSIDEFNTVFQSDPDVAYGAYRKWSRDLTLDYFDAQEKYLESQGKSTEQIRYERSKYENLSASEMYDKKDLGASDEEFVKGAETRAMNAFQDWKGADITILTSDKNFERANDVTLRQNYKILQARQRLRQLGYDELGRKINTDNSEYNNAKGEAGKIYTSMQLLNDEFSKYDQQVKDRLSEIEKTINAYQKKEYLTPEEEANANQLYDEYEKLKTEYGLKGSEYESKYNELNNTYTSLRDKANTINDQLNSDDKATQNPEVEALVKILKNTSDEKDFIQREYGVDMDAITQLQQSMRGFEAVKSASENASKYEAEKGISRFSDSAQRAALKAIFDTIIDDKNNTVSNNLTKGAVNATYKLGTGLIFSPYYLGQLFTSDDVYSEEDVLSDIFSDISNALDPFTTVRNDADIIDKSFYSIGSMLPIMAAMGTGAGALEGAGMTPYLANLISGFGATFPMNYQSNISSGMNPNDASKLAFFNSLVESALEGIFPEGEMYNAYIKNADDIVRSAVKQGKSVNEIAKDVINAIPETMRSKAAQRIAGVLEGATLNTLEEFSQSAAVNTFNTGFNLVNNTDIAPDSMNGEDAILTAVPSLITGGAGKAFIDLKSTKTRNAIQEGLMYVAANNPNFISEVEKQYPDYFENNKSLLENVQKIATASKNIPGYDELPSNLKAHIVSELQRKFQIEETMKDLKIKDERSLQEIANIEKEVSDILTGKYNQKPEENAIQKPSTEEVHGSKQAKAPEAGSQPQGVGTSVQGQETTQEGGQKEIVPGSEAVVADVKIKYPTEEEKTQRRDFRSTTEYVESTADRIDEFDPEELKKDLGGTFGLLTAENPMGQPLTEEENTQLNAKAEQWLKDKGYSYKKITGKYGQAENSFFVPKLSKEDALEFAKLFNQDSIAHSEGFIYQDGRMHPRLNSEDNFSLTDSYNPNSDNVSVVKSNGALKTFSVGYDFGTTQQLEGGKKEAPAGKRLFNEPNAETAQISQDYKKSKNIEYGPGEKITKIDTDRAMKIADAFEAMQDTPDDPEVQKAYEAMADETGDQFKAITDRGYTVELWDGNGEPYANSEEMIKDLKENKHMYIFSTEQGFGNEPITEEQRKQNKLLEDSGFKDVNGKTLLYNDLFRFVHDFFGHSERGNGFGPLGEENAWDVHARMYSPLARRAMTTETRGQNSWVNFGPQMRNEDGTLKKKGDEGYLEPNQREFAAQKMGLLPEEFSQISDEATPNAEEIPDVEAKDDSRKLFEQGADLYNQIKEAEGATKKRSLKAEREDLFKSNPTAKFVDENLKAITDDLEQKGLIQKKGDCP